MLIYRLAGRLGLALPVLLLVAPALASDAIDTGDTAWILNATALVLFRTLPGLALFYAGLVQAKNVVSVLMQHFALACLMSLFTASTFGCAAVGAATAAVTAEATAAVAPAGSRLYHILRGIALLSIDS